MSIKISQDVISNGNNMPNVGGGMSKGVVPQKKSENVLMDLDSIFSSSSGNQPQSSPMDANPDSNQQKLDFDSIFGSINFNAVSSNPVTDSGSINNVQNEGNNNKNQDTQDIYSQFNNVKFVFNGLDLWE
jgi:hypothetical protein